MMGTLMDDDKDFKEQMAARYQERMSMGYTSAGTDDLGRDDRSRIGDFYSIIRSPKSIADSKSSHGCPSDIAPTLPYQTQAGLNQGDLDGSSGVVPVPSYDSASQSSAVMRDLIQKFEQELPELEKKQTARQRKENATMNKTSSMFPRRMTESDNQMNGNGLPTRRTTLPNSPEKPAQPQLLSRNTTIQQNQPQQLSHTSDYSTKQETGNGVLYRCNPSNLDSQSIAGDSPTHKMSGCVLPYRGNSSPCLSDGIDFNSDKESSNFPTSGMLHSMAGVSAVKSPIRNGVMTRSVMSPMKEELIVGPKPPISPEKVPSFHKFTLKRKVSMGSECQESSQADSQNNHTSEKSIKPYKQRILINGQKQPPPPPTGNSRPKSDCSYRRIKRVTDGDKVANKAATSMERYLMFLKRSSTPSSNISAYQHDESKDITEGSATNNDETTKSVAELAHQYSSQHMFTHSEPCGVKEIKSRDSSESRKSPRRPFTKRKYGIVSPNKIFKRPSSASMNSDIRRKQSDSEPTPRFKTRSSIDRRSPSQKRKTNTQDRKNTSTTTLQSSGDTLFKSKKIPRRYGTKFPSHNNRSLTNKCSANEPNSKLSSAARKLEHASSSTLSSIHKDGSPDKIGARQQGKVSKLLSRYEEAKTVLHQSRKASDRDMNLSFDGSRTDGIKDILLTEDELADTNLVPVHLRKTHYLTPERSEDSMHIRDNVLDLLSGLSSTDEEESGYMYIADRLKQIKSNRIFKILQSPDNSPGKLASTIDDVTVNLPSGGRIIGGRGRMIKRPTSKSSKSINGGSRATSLAPASLTNSAVNYRSSNDSCVTKPTEPSSSRPSKRITQRRSLSRKSDHHTSSNSRSNNMPEQFVTVESSPCSAMTHFSSRKSSAQAVKSGSQKSKLSTKAKGHKESNSGPYTINSSPCLKKDSAERSSAGELSPKKRRSRGYHTNSPSPNRKTSSVDEQIAILLNRKWRSLSPLSSLSQSHIVPPVSQIGKQQKLQQQKQQLQQNSLSQQLSQQGQHSQQSTSSKHHHSTQSQHSKHLQQQQPLPQQLQQQHPQQTKLPQRQQLQQHLQQQQQQQQQEHQSISLHESPPHQQRRTSTPRGSSEIGDYIVGLPSKVPTATTIAGTEITRLDVGSRSSRAGIIKGVSADSITKRKKKLLKGQKEMKEKAAKKLKKKGKEENKKTAKSNGTNEVAKVEPIIATSPLPAMKKRRQKLKHTSPPKRDPSPSPASKTDVSPNTVCSRRDLPQPEWYKQLRQRSFRKVSRLCSEPTQRWPMTSSIPLIIMHGPPRNRSEVVQQHRRCLDDLTDTLHPCRIPVTLSFRRTLEEAACEEWVLHRWTSPDTLTKDDSPTASETLSRLSARRTIIDSSPIPLETPIKPPPKKARFGRIPMVFIGAWLCLAGAVHVGFQAYNNHGYGDDYDYYCNSGDDWHCMMRTAT